jgi:hypothetical protein
MADEGQAADQAKDRAAELVSVELGDFPPLGGDVRLKLAGRRTVLVGRNGAGKSSLLEGLWLAGLRAKVAIVDEALTGVATPVPPVPRRFACELRDAAGVPLRYEYQARPKLEERCYRPETGTTCWTLKDGIATFGDGVTIPMTVPAGVLSLAGYLRTQPNVPIAEVELLSGIFSTMVRIPAGIPRQQGRFPELIVTIHHQEAGGARYETTDSERRIGRLAKALVIAQERDAHGMLAEFEELGRRLGAWQEIAVELYDARRGIEARKGGSPTVPIETRPGSRQLATVAFDGVDVGLLADGTLRIAEILWALVSRPRTGPNLLLIEEPETGLYPGLLTGLLDTIAGYSLDRQIILSTHSAQVVNWASPRELRLVSRPAGKTRVRSLNEDHVSQLLTHLQGRTLGQFVYSGVLDGED